MSAIVLLSGGLDSTTALADTMDNSMQVTMTMSVDYGQRHSRELAAATTIADQYGVPHMSVDLSGWARHLSGSALTDTTVTVPHADYSADSMAATVVPNRNGTFIMAAAGIAETVGASTVVTGVHGGDHELYPDCRPEFIYSLAATVNLGTGYRVQLSAPFLHWTKGDIVATAAQLDAPLAATWSCYENGAYQCGECGTCRERRSAFHDADVIDPTVYSTV